MLAGSFVLATLHAHSSYASSLHSCVFNLCVLIESATHVHTQYMYTLCAHAPLIHQPSTYRSSIIVDVMYIH